MTDVSSPRISPSVIFRPETAKARSFEPTRRIVLAGIAGTVLVRPATAEPEDMAAAIRTFTGGDAPRPGKVSIDVAPLVENGNSVAVAVSVDHPITPETHVAAIALFNEKNPQPNVATFHLGPRSGRAWVASRIRLATSQHIAAVARLSDGSCWIDTKEVIVTIAACTEE